ncbi:MAG: Flp family type IVb pilin [Ahrensia sp.]
MNLLKRFGHDTRAATAIEYGLIATLIAVAIIGGTSSLGGSLTQMWASTARIVGGIIGG